MPRMPAVPLPRPKVPADMPGAREFVVMMALVMALNALAIDTMLPALPAMAAALHAPSDNAQQAIISLYFFGLAFGSLLHGPLADRFGRRRIILGSIIAYIIVALATPMAQSWTMLLAIRFFHGLCGAAMGVVATAVVRDRTAGDQMARVLSLIFLIFMVVPIIAPSIGQLILLVAPWPAIFLMLAGLASVMGLWVWLRLGETLNADDRLPLKLAPMWASWRQVATHRQAMAYMIGSSLAVGANYGFLNSAQQIIAVGFGRADIFTLCFACVAGGIAVANFWNARLVLHFGARRVSQSALIAFLLLSFVQFYMASAQESLWGFIVIVSLNMGMIGFIGANFSSIAMQPFGHIAGTASSFQNAVRTVIAAAVGAIIGAQFDGSSVPLAKGYMACGALSLLFVLWAEKGRLFTRPNPPHLP